MAGKIRRAKEWCRVGKKIQRDGETENEDKENDQFGGEGETDR